MGKINVLDKHTAELIAAGEVVERPASIIKELLENSIDAKSSCITVEIKNGGISFIRITDNGEGFEKDDMPLAFLRHATSKVKTSNDLHTIETLGFRGEALASISSVARVELLSKTKIESLGNRYAIDGGEELDFSQAGCPDGTTIIVRDLFYNIPARLKFLKKDTSEANAIQSIVEKIALSHPDISFKLIRDNKLVLHTSGDNKMQSCIYTILGKEFADSLLPLDYTYNGIAITGFTTKTSYSKSNRTMQHFFVNDRYVKAPSCFTAVQEAYKNSLMTSKYAGCVINIKLDFSKVDVNVHPAKTEVKFLDEKSVFEAIYFAIKTALTQNDTLKASVPVNTVKTISQEVSPFKNQENKQYILSKDSLKKDDAFLKVNAQEYNDMMNKKNLKVSSPAINLTSLYKKDEVEINTNKSGSPKIVDVKKTPVQDISTKESTSFSFLSTNSFEKKETQNSTQLSEEKQEDFSNTIVLEDDSVDIKYIGELFKTYILFQTTDTFILLDKHAAHERILFEKLKKDISLSTSQILLVPKFLPLSTQEKDIIYNNKKTLENFGFRFKEDDNQNILLTEAPLVLHKYNLEELVADIIKNISLNKIEIAPDDFFELLHSMACKSAIKANDNNTKEELLELAQLVYNDPNIRHCPHGRPVGLVYTKYQIEKMFGRIV